MQDCSTRWQPSGSVLIQLTWMVEQLLLVGYQFHAFLLVVWIVFCRVPKVPEASNSTSSIAALAWNDWEFGHFDGTKIIEVLVARLKVLLVFSPC